MNKLFAGKDMRTYVAPYHENLRREIEQMSDEEILACDFQDWEVYLEGKYSIAPIVLYDNAIQTKLTERKISVPNDFYSDGYGPEYYLVDGVAVIFTIPYDGTPELFEIQPNPRIMSVFPIDDFKKPCGDQCGSFTLSLEFKNKELEGKGEDMSQFVQKRFDQKFQNYQKMIQYVNNEAATYNKSLRKTIITLLTQRKDRADTVASISKALQIPLSLNPFAPKLSPIPIKPRLRTPPTRPDAKPIPKEWGIREEDYQTINQIIWTYGTAMEETARTYILNNEEELRDHLLAALNTYYLEGASGETFRRTGKTDIRIVFENKAAFIGECKIWHGKKLLGEAVQQVMNYSTWRDIKVSVIVFNKENQGFRDILNNIQSWVNSNTASHERVKENYWRCQYYKKDNNENVSLAILAFDLYIDKNQIQDSRIAKK